MDSEPFSCQAILDSISDGVFTVGSDWKVTSFNRAAVEITGIPEKEALGRYCSEVFRSSLCGADCPLKKTVVSEKPVIGRFTIGDLATRSPAMNRVFELIPRDKTFNEAQNLGLTITEYGGPSVAAIKETANKIWQLMG